MIEPLQIQDGTRVRRSQFATTRIAIEAMACRLCRGDQCRGGTAPDLVEEVQQE